jgi:hypothetical protein
MSRGNNRRILEAGRTRRTRSSHSGHGVGACLPPPLDDRDRDRRASPGHYGQPGLAFLLALGPL